MRRLRFRLKHVVLGLLAIPVGFVVLFGAVIALDMALMLATFYLRPTGLVPFCINDPLHVLRPGHREYEVVVGLYDCPKGRQDRVYVEVESLAARRRLLIFYRREREIVLEVTGDRGPGERWMPVDAEWLSDTELRVLYPRRAVVLRKVTAYQGLTITHDLTD
jgi:hypothetical protein